MTKTVLKDVEFLNLPERLDDIDDEVRVERADRRRPADDAQATVTARTIGRNLARLRTNSGLDVASLAARLGETPAHIEAIERGEALGNLRELWRIAAALSVPFGVLLDGTILSEASDGAFLVQRAGEGRLIESPGGLRSRILTPDGVAGAREVYELTLEPGAKEVADAHGAATCEHIVVTAGQLVVHAGGKDVTLDVGDAIFFRADVDHHYLNRGTVDAKALLVMEYA